MKFCVIAPSLGGWRTYETGHTSPTVLQACLKRFQIPSPDSQRGLLILLQLVSGLSFTVTPIRLFLTLAFTSGCLCLFLSFA